MVPFTSEVLSKVAGFGKPRPDTSWLSVSFLLIHCRDFRSFGSEALIGALQETRKPSNSLQIESKIDQIDPDCNLEAELAHSGPDNFPMFLHERRQ